ncbi:holo-ACP synthase [Rhizosaccharibacter radicis]|uniref:Holo-[acyl-carrier-protein] synthase n=1 Tax=Rhizosaccharibacter radicis TaxID=2782605 RepID=A0ABT1VV92_9PROT|nr:holo-ACP synthase [Acetobacteraceae bacterium KSS12]
MIVGFGTDLCDIRRVEAALGRYGDRFVRRCFTETERAKAAGRTEGLRAATFAKRWAAKEACAKALGTGFSHGVFHSDMGVVNLPGGRPTLVLTGGALLRLQTLIPAGHEPLLLLTLTDEPPYALAQVMIQALPA